MLIRGDGRFRGSAKSNDTILRIRQVVGTAGSIESILKFMTDVIRL